jgi:arginine:ornithine antiporter/lysine permease
MSRGRRIGARAVGVVCTLYCLWMLYAGNLSLLLLTTVFYLAGTPFYISARREYAPPGKALFGPRDRAVLAALSVCAVTAVALYALDVVRL